MEESLYNARGHRMAKGTPNVYSPSATALSLLNLPAATTSKTSVRQLLTQTIGRDPGAQIQLYKTPGNPVCWCTLAVPDYQDAHQLVAGLNGYLYHGYTLQCLPQQHMPYMWDDYPMMYMPMYYYPPPMQMPRRPSYEGPLVDEEFEDDSNRTTEQLMQFNQNLHVDPCQLFVGNVPFNATFEKLWEFLNGPESGLSSLVMQRQANGNFKGFAIGFTNTASESVELIRNYNGAVFEDRELLVRYDKWPREVMKSHEFKKRAKAKKQAEAQAQESERPNVSEHQPSAGSPSTTSTSATSPAPSPNKSATVSSSKPGATAKTGKTTKGVTPKSGSASRSSNG